MSELPPEPVIALEPETLPEQPLTAAKAEALIAKEIGLPMSRVQLKVSGQLVLQALLRLPDGVTLEDAAVEPDSGGAALLLTADFPDAPPGAASADLTYTRHTGWPDPLALSGVRWLHEDGSEIKPEPAAEA